MWCIKGVMGRLGVPGPPQPPLPSATAYGGGQVALHVTILLTFQKGEKKRRGNAWLQIISFRHVLLCISDHSSF